eukprot:6470439-Alexandrium_andersonii.AAC.1
MDSKEAEGRRCGAKTRLGSAVKLYESQLDRGAHCLREHLASAPSWQRLLQRPGILTGIRRVCRVGVRAGSPNGDGGPQLVREPSRWALCARSVEATVLAMRQGGAATHGWRHRAVPQ